VSAAGQVCLYCTDREACGGRHLVRDTVIAALAFAYAMWAIGNSGDDVVEKGFMLLMAGIPVYIAMKVWPTKTTVKPAVAIPLPRAARFERVERVEREKRTPVAH